MISTIFSSHCSHLEIEYSFVPSLEFFPRHSFSETRFSVPEFSPPYLFTETNTTLPPPPPLVRATRYDDDGDVIIPSHQPLVGIHTEQSTHFADQDNIIPPPPLLVRSVNTENLSEIPPPPLPLIRFER